MLEAPLLEDPGTGDGDSPALRALQWRAGRRDARLREEPELTKIVRLSPPGAGGALNVAVFGTIHGDECSGSGACHRLAAWAEQQPEAMQGFNLYLFPECNPSGLLAGTRHACSGLDLNREFWCGSDQPEVRRIEAELRARRFDVIISLHEDDTSPGTYGFVSGALLSAHLLEPALEAASRLLPRNEEAVIDGFPASRGIISEGYRGILTAPPEQRPHALEIVFETPGLAPLRLRIDAAVIAVQTILTEYRKLLAVGGNL